jgi:two-component system NtrC family sensor kinase
MATSTLPPDGRPEAASAGLIPDRHYDQLLRSTLIRLLLMYFVPLLLLVTFFHFQHRHLFRETRIAHLQSIAEHQAYTLDLFLRERIVNLENIIDDPRLPLPPTSEALKDRLDELRKTSDTFVDLGWFNAAGDLVAYAGPHPDLETRNYGEEAWFLELRGSPDRVVITDVYLGFREAPHFTIAVHRILDGRYVALRAVLSPERIEEYLNTLQQNEPVVTSLLGSDGEIQVVASHDGRTPAQLPLPPRGTPLGAATARAEHGKVFYAWAWLRTTPWVLRVESGDPAAPAALISGGYGTVIAAIGVVLLLELVVIIYRARRVVRKQRHIDAQEAELSGQLVQAAKLATVGELAAGIAHEINNPLAIIAEEAGLVRDKLDPAMGFPLTDDDLRDHLANIHEAAFRARDITRKLLGFVRQTEVDLGHHNLRDILDHVVDGLLGSEIETSNIRVVRDYSPSIPGVLTDRNQIEQVLLNLVKNACDAMDGDGTLTLHVSATPTHVSASVSDTGCGMGPDLREKIFMPFFTTKDVGKGTGLGLSVSYGIVKSLRGDIYVDSKPGVGSMFTVELPLDWDAPRRQERSINGGTAHES